MKKINDFGEETPGACRPKISTIIRGVISIDFILAGTAAERGGNRSSQRSMRANASKIVMLR